MKARPAPGGRRREILDEATRLFSEKGYAATSMRDLAKASGMQPATLYSHISGKEMLLFQILDDMVQTLAAGAAEIIEGNQPADEKLRRFCRFHMQVVAENLPAATVHFHEYRHLPTDRLQDLVERRDAYEAGVRSIIEDGIKSGIFRPVDVPMTAISALSLLNYAYHWFSPDGPLSPGEVGDSFADLLLTGIRTPAG